MKLKNFLKTSFIFLVGNILMKLVSFFLLPLYTGKIDPAQFGNYDVAVSFINLLAPVAFFQIWDGMFRYAFDYKDRTDKQKVIGNSVAVTAAGIPVFLCLILLVQAFFKLDYFGYVIIYGILFALHYLHTYAARVYLSNRLFVLSGIASTLVTAIINIVLILGFHWDIKSIYVAAIAGLLTQILVIELRIGVFRSFRLRNIDRELIQKMLRFSVPLCLATVSYWLLSGLTKVFIQDLVGDHANGLYAVANKFGSLITILVSVFQFAWNETAYLMTDESQTQRRRSYNYCMNLMVVSVFFGAAILLPLIKLIFPYVIGSQYAKADSLIPATVIGVAANALAGFIGTLFMAEKKNGFIMISTFISAGANIVAGYFLTGYFGLHGAVTTLAVCFFLLFLLRYVRIIRLEELRPDRGKLLLSIFTLSVSASVYFLIASRVIQLLCCIGFIGLFVICMKDYLIHFFSILTRKK